MESTKYSQIVYEYSSWNLILVKKKSFNVVIEHIERIENAVNKYIRSTFMLHAVQQYKRCNIDEALRVLKEENNNSDAYYRVKLEVIENTLPGKDDKEFDKYTSTRMSATSTVSKQHRRRIFH